MVKIRFTRHFNRQQAERDDWMFNVDTTQSSLEHQEELEWKMLHHGKWYENTRREGPPSYYCVLNHLQVYCAVKEGDTLIVTTTYPYSKSFKVKTLRCPKVEFTAD